MAEAATAQGWLCQPLIAVMNFNGKSRWHAN